MEKLNITLFSAFTNHGEEEGFAESLDAIENIEDASGQDPTVAQNGTWLSSFTKMFAKKRKKRILAKCI